MKPSDAVLDNEKEVLRYLKDQFPVFHLSNIFFRDIQYGIQSFLKGRNLKISYSSAEEIARQFVAKLEKEEVLRPVDRQTWMVNLEEFKKPLVKPVASAPKPAPAPTAS